MKLFKGASASPASPGRSRPGTSSIRGRISNPIPIPSAADDDEFPIRRPGTGFVDKSPEEEFPIRQLGTSGATPNTPQEWQQQQPQQQQPPSAQPNQQDFKPEDYDTTPEERHQQPLQSTIDDSRPENALSEAPVEAPPTEHPLPTHGPVTPTAPMAPAPLPVAAPAVAPEPAPPSTPKPTPARTSHPSARGSGNSPANSNSNSNNSNRTQFRRTNVPSTVRYSAISNNSANTGALSSDSRPQRKKSTLRNALSKLFGRKKKKGTGTSSTAGDTDRTSSVMPSQHRSDTSGLVRVKETESKRSASLPITEYDRALRSHSIGPNDFSTIENVRNSIHGDMNTPRRRALTATDSRLFGTPAKRNELGEWGGLSPRPVSAHGRGRVSGGEDDPEMIGRAITSDMDTGTGYNTKRRSRSLSGIDALGGHLAHVGPDGTVNIAGGRRRSDEIRYWRESYGASYLSPLSSTHPETEGDQNEYRDGDNDDTGVISVDPTQSLAARPATSVAPDSPPQPFNFGSLATMNEMAGMKITQAASLEARVNNVEGRTDRLERVVDQLCNTVSGQQGGHAVPAAGSNQFPRSMQPQTDFWQAPSSYLREPRADQSSSRYTSSRPSVETDGLTTHSHMSFGEGQTLVGGLHPPSNAAAQPGLPPIAASPSSPGSLGFPRGSMSTVRGAMSLPALSVAAASDAATADLAAQLEAERAERLALELQLKKLSERVNVLSSTMFAMLRDPQKNRSQERLTPSSGAGENRLSRTSSSSHLVTPTKVALPQSGIGIRNSPAPVPIFLEPPPSLNKFQSSGNTLSGFEDTGDEESDRGAESVSESFMTPREEYSPHTYGAFGEELRDETEDEMDPKRKKAARTLSLSQLTLNKGQRAVV
ncbi:hypothetical protein MCOR11_006717 [Pyricularia oryzae]|nr:hypothetical protein MCOR01_007610 [Pyricularia oryzae]KAI6492398.1 hypothetical protein MCOR11_006717 [Pyricularia oryzae]